MGGRSSRNMDTEGSTPNPEPLVLAAPHVVVKAKSYPPPELSSSSSNKSPPAPCSSYKGTGEISTPCTTCSGEG
ncbi:unnamed protein product [Lactuca virosa]|uniref:Uncharacterized protein n=1 Tax=Lactuca virosa TaxID=75947 RepID=A0AAU9LRQ6_9ASTR|nr:unnamed protein product [Lactuca virosa]